ncbi:ATP-binding protein [Nitrosophilus alvini]|uniref:ATP-binding protein n=1 Tax=Nitrosophilus alvini TaxID=2714855 RepID=UPI00190B1D0C|nr:ATP-binding protein [Nitrosophilus alvini]
MFINRTNELNSLNSEYRKKGSSFSVIYSKRRVGKTALIEEFIKDKPHIYFYATEVNLNLQLELFSKEITRFFALPKEFKFESFENAFEYLAKAKIEEKLIIAIDEFQNLTKVDKTFSSTLQKAWDMFLSKSNIHLILCGSVISMMHSEVLNYNAPLYGRRTNSIHLKPIKFRYLNEFLPNLDIHTLLKTYSSFGSTPKYLLLYDPKLSFEENLKENILDKNSYLYSEGYFLLKQEISETPTYFSILEVISKGDTKIGNIASSLGVNASFLTRYLNKLIELDILEKEVPVTEKNPLKSKFGRYRIKDKFLNFWFYYVYKNYSYLEIGEIEAVMQEIELNFIDRFVSFAFEEVIKEQIIDDPEKFLDFKPMKVGRWWNNKEEIDIVAFDDKNIAFIECKYQEKVDKKKVLNELIKKTSYIKHNKKEHFLVVTKEELKKLILK